VRVATERLYRLRPWLIRGLIPEGHPGSYVLFRGGSPVYTGRSDECLRRRLLAHAYSRRGQFFAFEVHGRAIDAFTRECALYHAFPTGLLENQIHPATPIGERAICPFCEDTVRRTRIARREVQPTAAMHLQQRGLVKPAAKTSSAGASARQRPLAKTDRRTS